jgi:nucleotide-binding universal stress UspA family protein
VKKILIAYDGSAGALLAMKELIHGGFPECAEARVITIADVWMPPPPESEKDSYPRQQNLAGAQARALEALHDAKKIAISGATQLHEIFPDWSVSNLAKADSPAWGILAEAAAWEADLIVVGSHGRKPLERFFLGSVSYKVAAEANCSVRVVRSQKNKFNDGPLRILIAFDGSDDSHYAIEEVLKRRWPARTEVELVTVLDAKIKSQILRTSASFEQAKEVVRIENWITPQIESLRARFSEKEIQARSHILEGDPKSIILHNATESDADVIFLGARGLDHGDRLYLGTLASAICTRAHCTVEVIRSRSKVPAARKSTD